MANQSQQNPKSKPGAKPSSASNAKRVSDSIKSYVDQLAMALGQVIPAERTLLYIRALSDLSEAQLAHGFEIALKHFKPEFGRVFPIPGEIREWALQWRPEPIRDTRRILDRGDKPPGWEPLKPGEVDELLRQVRQVATSNQNGPATTREGAA